MPGLDLNLMGRVKANAGNGFSTSPGNGTATDLGFGAGAMGPNTDPSAASVFAPNNPCGIAVWASLAAIGLLLVIRHSLPN